MSAQHTQGRLVVRVRQSGTSQYSDLRRADDLEPDPRGERAVATAYTADARRLAACWNALEGVPTEVVESLVAGALPKALRDQDELATVRADIQAVEANYEVARALLEELPTGMWDIGEFDSGLAARIRAFLKGGK